ncbi:peptide MFS transporter [bacterium]|nr:peptide MFS transporter [bacterium]
MYSVETAGKIYGLYTGFVYLTPLIGGYLADRYFGQRKCITAGAILMSCGLFTLAFAPKSLFLAALFMMIMANGFIKSNISSVLGLLYGNDNGKKDSAFTVFYMGINFGAFLSPLICGTIAVKYGFEYGFAAAGCGMLLGLSLYKIFENKLLKDCGKAPVVKNNSQVDTDDSGSAGKIVSLLTLMLFTIPFWICFEQAGSSLTLFAQYATNRSFLGFEIPTEYFQSLNPLFIITLAPLISLLWEVLRNKSKEPTSVEKFAISLFLMTIAYLIMCCAAHLSSSEAVSPLWLVGGYFVMTLSELCLSPIGLSLVSKLAPKKFLSVIMGTWFLTSFFGNMLAGLLGGKYETMGAEKLFALMASLSFVTFIILLFFIPKLNKVLIKPKQ